MSVRHISSRNRNKQDLFLSFPAEKCLPIWYFVDSLWHAYLFTYNASIMTENKQKANNTIGKKSINSVKEHFSFFSRLKIVKPIIFRHINIVQLNGVRCRSELRVRIRRWDENRVRSEKFTIAQQILQSRLRSFAFAHRRIDDKYWDISLVHQFIRGPFAV